MDASALTPDEVRELATLRRRAYGPGPGIGQGDLARMEQLETLSRAFPFSGDGGSPRSEDVFRVETTTPRASEPPDVAPALMETSGVDTAAPAEMRTLPGGATPRWSRRAKRRAVSIGVVAIAVAGLGWALSQWLGPHPDVTLRPLVAADGDRRLGVIEAQALRNFGMDGTEVQEYDSYHALRAWVTRDEGQRCLAIYAASYGPAGAVSCTPSGLDPTVDVRIYPTTPRGMTRGLPVGSVIRFVLAGDEVLVWERVAGAER